MKGCLLGCCSRLLLLGVAWPAETASTGSPTGCAAAETSAVRCADACGGSACKVCVPELTKKKQDKVSYSSKSSDFCVPRPSLQLGCGDGTCSGADCHACAAPAGACQGCGGVGCIKCGHVRTKKVLIKKVKTTETDSYKCVPQSVCGDQGHGAPCR